MRWMTSFRLSMYPGCLIWFKPFQADLGTLPFEIDLSPSRSLGFALIAIVLFLDLGVAALVAQTHGTSTRVLYLAYFMIPASLFFLFFAYLIISTRRTALFGPLDVHVTEVDGREWRSKYNELLGIARREIVRYTNQGVYRFQVIELIHADRSKALPLFVKRGDWSEQSLLELYARQLRMPIVPFVPSPPRRGTRYRKDQTVGRP